MCNPGRATRKLKELPGARDWTLTTDAILAFWDAVLAHGS